MSIRDDDLEKLDAFAGERRVSRGDAVGLLLESYRPPALESDSDPDYIPPPPAYRSPPAARLALGKAVLKQAQKYTGVSPVIEGYDDELIKVADPEAEENLDRFYEKKTPQDPGKSGPDGWEEPP